MPAKKKLRSEPAKPSDEVVSWIKANDKLIGTTPVTIDQVLGACTIKDFKEQVYSTSERRVVTTGRTVIADWKAFREALEGRTADSPMWFIQRRIEDLLLEPDGTIGERVESFVIVESSNPTLAPLHYIVADPLPDADQEDHVPSRVLLLAEQDVKWNPITKADGSSINAFILQRKSVVPAFSFGASSAPAATASTTETPAGGFGFGFGSSTPSAPTGGAGFAFGFGSAPQAASVPAPTAPTFSFGFGAVAPSSEVPTSASPPAPTVTKRIPVEDILFTIWTEGRAKEMKKLASSGSRIVIEDFKLPGEGKSIKLVMQDDVKDTPSVAAAEFVLKKLFARQNSRIKDFDQWMDTCPEMDPHLLEVLQKARAKILKAESKVAEASDDEKTYSELWEKFGGAITAALDAAVARRKPIHDQQVAVFDDILQMLKEMKLASKDRCRVLKYYPANNEIPFRPFGKVSGINEEGEEAICTPPAYRFINPFTGKKS